MNMTLLKAARNKRLYLPLVLLHTVVNSVFIIVNTYLLALMVNSVFILKQGITQIKFYLVYFILNAVLKLLTNFALEISIKCFSDQLKDSFTEGLFSLITDSNPQRVKSQNTGELLNLLTDGSEALTAYYSQYLPQLLASVLIPIVIFIFVMFKDGLSSVILLLTYPLIPLFMALIGFKSKEKNEAQWKTLTILSSHFLDMLQGLRTLKSFGRSKVQEKKVFQVSEDYRKATIEVLKISFLSALVLETSATISTAVVAVNLGLRLVYHKIDFLTAFLILIITPEYFLPLRQLGTKFHSSLNGQIAAEKIVAIQAKFESKTQKNRVPREYSFNKAVIENSHLHEKQGYIKVTNLNFSHENKEALINVNLTISPKEKIAIVGESGGGKTTLINILSGLLCPPDNTVFINDRDINSIDESYLAKKIALVPQEPYIFNLSLKENIILGSVITEESFYSICQLSRINEFAIKFQFGYDTIIGDGEKVELSGGEKQRIALARALVKNADIFILDEPTSAMDSETEELLSSIFNTALKDRTVILAAHRLNTIRAADRILVLGEGSLLEAGTHQELLLKSGRYVQMLSTAEVI